MGDISDIAQAVLIVFLVILILAVVSLLTSDYRESWPPFIKDFFDFFETSVDGLFGWSTKTPNTSTDTPDGTESKEPSDNTGIDDPAVLAKIMDITAVKPKRNNPAKGFIVKLGTSRKINQFREFIPDGAWSALPTSDGKRWIRLMSWAENRMSIADSPYPDSGDVNGKAVYGWSPCTKQGSGYDNGSSWLMSTYRISGKHLIGFVHFEQRSQNCGPGSVTVKSMGVIHSYDDGNTWSQQEQTLTDPDFLNDTRDFGGVGDGCGFRDYWNNRWIMLFTGNGGLNAAASSDTNGKRGSWKAWNGSSFSLDCLPAARNQRKNLPGLTVDGANPCVSWNTYLQSYVCMWHQWEGGIVCAISADGISWIGQKLIFPNSRFGNGRVIWYPSLFGAGTNFTGKNCKLLVADCAPGCSSRSAEVVDIEFTRT